MVHNSIYLRDNPYLQIDADWVFADRPYDKIVEWTNEDGFGFGFGVNGGLLFSPSDKLTLGASFAVPFKTTVDGSAVAEFYMPRIGQSAGAQDDPGGVEMLLKSGSLVVDTADFEASITLPASLGAGLAYRVSEQFLVSLDLHYTLWSQFDGFKFEYSNHKLSSDAVYRQVAMKDQTLIDFFTSDLSRPVDWSDAMAAALGLRYDYSSLLTLMAGGSFDQSPSADNELFTPQFMELGDKLTVNGGFTLHIAQWDLSMVTGYTSYPEATTDQLVDLDNDGIFDSFTGEYKAGTYQTALSFNYRF
jgi:long-subunit fatty acid transport protein